MRALGIARGGAVAVAFVGEEVDERHAVELLHPLEGVHQQSDVVAVERADVADAEVLEDVPGHREVAEDPERLVEAIPN